MMLTLLRRAPRLLCLAALITSLPACAVSRTATTPATCTQGFTYEGAPVSAEVVAAFEPYVSDRAPPIVTEINLSAAQGSNQFAAESRVRADGRVSVDLPKAHYEYQVIGCAHDTFVLATERAPAGGSAVLKSVLFVRLDTRDAYGASGQERARQTFISVTRRVPMGDRDTAEVTMHGDNVEIGRSRYRDTRVSMHVAGGTP